MELKEIIVMKKIKDFVITECKKEFGFAGLTESEDFLIINSGKNKQLIIKISIKE